MATQTTMAEDILAKAPEIDEGNKRITGWITAKNGTKLFWILAYNKGGFNYFCGKEEPRCFEADVQRQSGEFAAFTGLDDPSGAVRYKLQEVSRFSKKQQRIALKLFSERIEGLLTKQYPEL